MSKEAVKSFFESSRTVKKLKLEAMAKKAAIIKEKKKIIDQTKLYQAFETIKYFESNYDEMLFVYFESFDDEQHNYIYSRKNEFSNELQNILWPEPILLNIKTNLKIVDFTDEMQQEIERKARREHNRKLDALLEKQVIPERPLCDVDKKVNELKELLKKGEILLEETLAKIKPKTYCPPAMRQKMIEQDPTVLDIKNKIVKIKNEITSTEQDIEKLNGRWKEEQRFQIRKILEREMLELPQEKFGDCIL